MRLIDADAMRNDWLENGENEYVYDTNAMLDSIDAQPTIDAVPVVHGEWIKRHNYSQGFYESTDYKCSVCGLERDWLGGENYCPNCGANMDVKEEVYGVRLC